MLSELKKVRFPVETGLLFAFCLVLPLVEFWKALFWLAYVLTWLVNRVRSRGFGGSWHWWDTLVLFWIGSAYLAAVFAGLGGSAWAKTGDVATHVLLLWLVMRGGYSERELRWFLGALVASTIAGLAYGYWRIWSGAGKSGTLQLHSVGHVNHSAIYLAVMVGVCVSWLFARWQAWPPGRRASGLAIALLVTTSLAVTASRGAIAAGFALVLLLAAAWWPRWRGALLGSVAAATIAAALLVGLGAEVVRKQLDNAAAGNVLSFRDGIWRMGLAAWEKYPWFGVGKDNYGRITPDRVREWRTEAGREYDASRYVQFPHAHNLYVNTLAERGAVGFAGVAALLVAWLVSLLRYRPRPDAGDFAWLAWGGAAGAWLVTAGVGIVNTTLHHEHGQLVVLLLGVWLSTLTARRAS
ncbi:MAG: O-antigen ligase family protein [Candidatus Parcubacteria bacterium]|nr:O-antigen ligase family protein [Burkholderiales bacterium]